MNTPLAYRRSIRLSGYDYSGEAAYFVTTCVQAKECLLGCIIDESQSEDVGVGLCSTRKMINHHLSIQLSALGQIVYDEWVDLPKRYSNIALHEFVIMPNHFHAILEITNNRAEQSPYTERYYVYI